MSKTFDHVGFAIVFAASIVFAIFLSRKSGEYLSDEKWKKELIGRGFAEHNPTNGVWQWKEAK